MKFSCLLVAESLRSRAYLQMLGRHGLQPSRVLLLMPRKRGPVPIRPTKETVEEAEALLGLGVSFDPHKDEASTCQYHWGWSPEYLATGDINDPLVTHAVKNLTSDVVVVSPPGRLGEDLLRVGKHFLHLHPGELPRYRGSTTFYYSLLEDRSLACTAFFLSSRMDSGPIVWQKKIQPVQTALNLDAWVDPLLRAATLVECLQKNPLFEPLPENGHEDLEFFVIHPVLRHQAILRTQKKEPPWFSG